LKNLQVALIYKTASRIRCRPPNPQK